MRPRSLQVEENEVVTVDGLRLTSIERTWCDLANVLTLPELVAAGDSIVWRRRRASTIARLAEAVAAYSERRGIRNLRWAVSNLSERSDSAPESELRVAILHAGLPAPTVNRPIYNRRGEFIAQTDFSWPDLRLALEYDGDHHRVEREQWFEDVRRINELQLIDWLALRAIARDYRDPAALLQRLSVAMLSRGWDGRRA